MLSVAVTPPLNEILVTERLSVTFAEKVMVCVFEEDNSVTLLSLTLNELILGAWSSLLTTVTSILSVASFPAASKTLRLTVSVDEPKL